MRRLLVGALFVSLSCASSAFAQDDVGAGALSIQQFRPVPGGDLNHTQVSGAGVLGHLRPSFGIYQNYGLRPLILQDEETLESFALVEHQVQADLLASVGLFDHAELGLALPVALYQTSEDAGALPARSVHARALGDMRIVPKWSWRGGAHVGGNLAAVAVLSVPTGDVESLQSDGGVSFEPRFVAEYRAANDTRLSANLGYSIRRQAGVLNVDLGNQVVWGAAWQQPILPGKWSASVEVFGRAPLDADSEYTIAALPVEALVSTRVRVKQRHAISLGAGPGITRGYGTPTVRALAGYTYSLHDEDDPFFDSDRDGIPNSEDACPDEQEDLDGFQDEDGCPDPDNDLDGILDEVDACPDDPEDLDGFEDEDGCPEEDNDRDTILDVDDACPNVPEDLDGFEDEDGCPEVDNDLDGVLDADDECPIEPEDFDGFRDEDGCPDRDNDRDGVLDPKDECPTEQEVYNGIEDEDGCPDEGLERVEFTRDRIILKEEIYFDTDRAKIQSRSRPVLKELAIFLLDHPEIMLIEIQGHTDDRGTQEWNMDLSWRRARNVRRYLIRRGVQPERLVIDGYGKTRPIVRGKDRESRQRNRRVVFRITKFEELPATAASSTPQPPDDEGARE